MPSSFAAIVDARSRLFDLTVFGAGMALFGYSIYAVARDGTTMTGLELIAVPLIVVIAKFPMVLDGQDGSIEVGFDSSVLMFLLCTTPAHEALVLWALGMLVTQITADKRPTIKLFNVGVGILSGAAAAGVLHAVRGSDIGTPRELLAVTLAAVAYFILDYAISGVSLALESATPVRDHLLQRGTIVAVACFVPFDSLGYLGAVVNRSTPWWTLLLLAVPLATLLVATRAVTRGSENARRLTVLFDAAVRAQTLSDTRQVIEALTDDARRLLRISRIEVRSTPPGPHEIGAQVQDGQREHWIVAPGTQRARSTMTADLQALKAMAAVSADAFSRLRLTEDMTHLARHDLLTDLPNRGLLLDRVKHALHLARRRGSPIALLFVDLDGFKAVNDRFGHAAGDAVLVEVAQRLTGCVRQRDTVARLGGDEFALLFEDVNPTDVRAACERILVTLGRGAHVAGHDVPLGASIGIAYGDGLDSAEAMLRNADLAMYEAKSRGKSRYVVYEPSIGRSRLQRLELVESLREAVVAKEITLAYQPMVNAATGQITGVEALARWASDGISVPPDVFIRVAEESGLIVDLGDVVLQRAAHDAASLREAAGGPIDISVNISALQLMEPEFVDSVRSALAIMGDTGLVLEITERDGIGTDDVSLGAMRELAEAGVHFAIDDFGVGFSSISYLQDMPVRSIKADASFSEGIDRDERSCALLCSIMMMGQALGFDVVVEGIERSSQLDHLREHVHATYAQGYLMHRPMALDTLLDVVRDNRSIPAALSLEPPRDASGNVATPA